MQVRILRRRELRPGLAGLNDTLESIRKGIDAGGRDWAIRREAELLTRHVASHDYDGQIRAIYEGLFGAGRPRYRRDPVNVELVKSARAMLDGHGGDCDDFTVLAGALFESIGFQVRPVVWGPEPAVDGRPPRFSHVYLEVLHPRTKRWVAFDPVLRNRFAGRGNAVAGDAPPGGVKAVLVAVAPSGIRPVTQASVDDVGFFDVLNNIGKALDFTDPKNSVIRDLVNAIPVVGATVVAAGDAVAAGRQLVKQTTGIDLGKQAEGVLKAAASSPAKPAVTSTAAPKPVLQATTVTKAPAELASKLVTSSNPAAQIIAKAPSLTQLSPTPPKTVLPVTQVTPVQTSAPAKSNTGLLVAGGVVAAGALAYALTR